MHHSLKRPLHEAIDVIEQWQARDEAHPPATFSERLKWRPFVREAVDLSRPLSTAGVHAVVLSAALRQKKRVGCFTTASSARRFALHLLAEWSGVDVQILREGWMCESDFPALTRAAGQLAGAPIRIDDTPDAGAWHIVKQSERWLVEVGVQLIVVDFFNRDPISMPPEIALFRDFSMRTGVPVILFHQPSPGE